MKNSRKKYKQQWDSACMSSTSTASWCKEVRETLCLAMCFSLDDEDEHGKNNNEEKLRNGKKPSLSNVELKHSSKMQN